MNITDRKELCSKIEILTKEVATFIQREREHFSSDKIEYKGHNNMVSYVDKTSEAMIIKFLKELIPDSDIIAEEGKYEQHEYKFRWIIDPLDGTTNFIHGFPPYSISIALQENTKTIIGVIKEITCGDIYYTWGDGSFLNGKKITVSSVEKLEDSLAITGLSYNMSEPEETSFVKLFDFFNRNTHGTRRTGSAAMNLAYIARGVADFFYQTNLSSWDVAAGAYLVEQAGGIVTDFKGTDDFIFGRTIIATNKNLYKTIKPIVTE